MPFIKKLHKMMKNLLRILTSLALIIFIANASSFIFSYNDSINDILNILMFSVIGLYYIIMSLSLVNNLYKFGILLCGVFLIIMNFLPENNFLLIIAVLSILLPMLIIRFSRNNIYKNNA